MSASNRPSASTHSSSSSLSTDDAKLAHIEKFYNKFWNPSGSRKKDEADTLLIIKDEKPPKIALPDAERLWRNSRPPQTRHILRYGERHYPYSFGITGTISTKVPKTRGGKRRYKRKTYKNKKTNK